jgi:hypothetical protein
MKSGPTKNNSFKTQKLNLEGREAKLMISQMSQMVKNKASGTNKASL